MARFIQSLEFPGSDILARFGYWVGTVPALVGASVLFTSGLMVARQYSGALLILAAVAVRGLNPLVKEIIDSPRPPSDLVRVTENATGLGFPSGHVTGTVTFYACVIFLAHMLIHPGKVRNAVQGLAVVPIIATSFSRVYSGAHWPSDVLGGYIWGITTLLPLIAGYYAIRDWRRFQP